MNDAYDQSQCDGKIDIMYFGMYNVRHPNQSHIQSSRLGEYDKCLPCQYERPYVLLFDEPIMAAMLFLSFCSCLNRYLTIHKN